MSNPTGLSVPALTAIAVMLAFVFAGAIECVWQLYRGRDYPWREAWVSIAVMLIEMPVAVLLGYGWGHELGLRGLDFFVNGQQLRQDPALTPTLGAIVLAFFIADLKFYLLHRVYHGSNLFWVYHSTHHSAERLHFLLGARLGIFRYGVVAMGGLIMAATPIFLGQTPLLSAAASAFVFFYQSLLHWDRFPRLGWLDYVLMTPSNHRVHHAYGLERVWNYGGVTALWDHLFRTFRIEPQEKLAYGIGAPAAVLRSPILVQFHALREMVNAAVAARGLRGRLSALFYH